MRVKKQRLRTVVERLEADVDHNRYSNDQQHTYFMDNYMHHGEMIKLILDHLGLEIVKVPAEPEKMVIRKKEVKT